jgi:hypothetical protein
MRGAPLPDIAQTGVSLVLTRDATVLVDLSSDKVTIHLRQWPLDCGNANNGRSCRLLFLH